MASTSEPIKGLRFALVAPESKLSAWRVQAESQGLGALTRFATRCDMLLGENELDWVCVHPTVSDTGLLELIAQDKRTIVSEELSQLKLIKSTYD